MIDKYLSYYILHRDNYLTYNKRYKRQSYPYERISLKDILFFYYKLCKEKSLCKVRYIMILPITYIMIRPITYYIGINILHLNKYVR